MIALRYPDAPGAYAVETSLEAAEALAPRLGPLQKLVHGAIVAAGDTGLTCEELAGLLELPRSTVQPRTSELQRKELIHDGGLRRRNPSSGKRAIAWLAGAKPPADLPPLPLLVVGVSHDA